jgi:hypothetical protein
VAVCVYETHRVAALLKLCHDTLTLRDLSHGALQETDCAQCQAHISCSNYIYKVNCTLHRMRRLEVQLYRSLTSAGPRHILPFTPGKETWWPMRLAGPRGRPGRVRKALSVSGFESRTAQPMASRFAVNARLTVIMVCLCTVGVTGLVM